MSCGIPPNGTSTQKVPETSLVYQDVYNYTCLPGFETNDFTSVCQPDRTWSLPNGALCMSKLICIKL